MTILHSEIILYLVRAACKLRSASYGSKHELQSLSNMPFMCILLCITWKLQVVCGRSIYQTTALLYCWRCSLWGLELHERSDWKTTAPDTLHSCSLVQHCHTYTTSPYIHHSLVCNYAWQQNLCACSLWLYCTLNNSFTAYSASFYKNRFG